VEITTSGGLHYMNNYPTLCCWDFICFLVFVLVKLLGFLKGKGFSGYVSLANITGQAHVHVMT
jgi:hypothetical protein